MLQSKSALQQAVGKPRFHPLKVVSKSPADDRGDGSALGRPPRKRAVATPGAEGVRVDLPLEVWIDDRDVSRPSDGQSTRSG